MNRTKEFVKCVDLKHQHEPGAYKKVFYDTFLDEIISLERRLNNKLTYTSILKLEDDLQRVVNNYTTTIEAIALEGTKDEKIHFEGVKKILGMRIYKLKNSLEKIKNSKVGLEIELAPERPKAYKEVKDTSYLQQKNLEIIESSMLEGYHITRQRLLEIESIQDTINEHLQIHDERIDNIIVQTGDVHKTINASRDLVDKGSANSRFFRRFLFILFLCLSFLILFMHLFHK